MKCEKSGEIVAYLKGEVEEAEREPLRLHFESCPVCAKELARFDRTLKAFGKLEKVEPSTGFAWNVRQAFAAAHPEFLERNRPRQRPASWWESLRAHFDFVPAWAVSVAVHVLLLAVAAILFLSPKSEEEELRDASIQAKPRKHQGGPEWRGDGPKRRSADISPYDVNDPSRDFRPDPDPDPDPKHRHPERDPFKPMDRKSWDQRLPKDNRILAFLESRTNEKAKEALRKLYGGEENAPAVRRALDWLAREQQPDGRWTYGRRDYEVGLTGLALLAFLADGHTPSTGEHRAVVEKGLNFLLAEQKANGLVGRPEGHYLYDHAIAALALLEAYLMTRSGSLQVAVSAAVAFTVSAQNATGGWGYVHRSTENDTSVAGWQIFLLRTALMSGDKSVIPALYLARDRTALLTDSEGKVGYRARLQFPNGYHALTAVGMLSHVMSNPSPDENLLARQSKLLLEVPPIVSTEPQGYAANDLYFAYFGTLAIFQCGGDAWAEWYPVLKKKLLEAQAKDGSWPSGFDKWSGYGGQVYTTAMSALVLEAPWRYPRLAD